MSKLIPGWYVMYTKPRHEKKLAEELERSETKCYLPLKQSLRNWHDRRKYIKVPLFQSYVFVYLNNLSDYYNGLNCSGALHYVRFGTEVVRISDQIIDGIRLLVEYGKDIEECADFLSPGRQLYINHGPLTGLSCEVVECGKNQKILVRIHLLQRNLLIALPGEYLIALHA